MKTVNIGPIDLNVVDRGSGAPLLLVHGFPLDHTMWNAQIEALSANRRVIAPDLRGFGLSGSAGDEVTDMRQFADDLAALFDALQIAEPITFCGLSMGGYIAWEFFRHHRQRLAALVLCDTRAAADSAEAARGRRLMASRVLAEGAQAVPDAMLPKLLAPQTLQEKPDVVESLRKTMLATTPESIAAAQRGMAARADSTALLGQIDVPVLVIVGQHDAITTAREMQQIAAAIPDAQFIQVPQAGHLSPLENPQVVSAAIEEFLR
ncbi:MAG: alpha/beta fold hydrolase [Planctomycetes bacterium]|nr:alpha/beta fold hydrolase [Planctomycetota bacterium]